MSIGTSHVYNKLDKDSAPIGNQRLVRLIAKANRDGKYASPHLQDSLCVSVPRVTQEQVVEHIDALIPYVIGMVQDVQDKIIREHRITTGSGDIHENLFSIGECIAHMEAASAGDRVSKEYLTEWFSSNYAPMAREWINSVAGGNLAESVIDAKCDVLMGMFTGFASPKYSPAIPHLRAMIRFAQSISDDAADTRMAGYVEKAIAMLDKKEKELSMDALGFA